jgi:hypothetical protein
LGYEKVRFDAVVRGLVVVRMVKERVDEEGLDNRE